MGDGKDDDSGEARLRVEKDLEQVGEGEVRRERIRLPSLFACDRGAVSVDVLYLGRNSEAARNRVVAPAVNIARFDQSGIEFRVNAAACVSAMKTGDGAFQP